MVESGKQFQMVFRNHEEQVLLSLPQIQKIVENSMPLTTAEYFVLLIQVLCGELDASWSKEYLLQHPWALAIRGED